MSRLRAAGLTVVPEIIASDLETERPYFVMPWYSDGSLQLAVTNGRFKNEPVAAIRLLINIGEAIASIHVRGYAHRDLKPDNIFIEGRSVILADFGLCLEIDDASRLTESAEPVGSRFYIAPENESGVNEDNDQRPADVYAYGKIVWAVLAGKSPFAREVYRQPSWRLSTICSQPKLDKLDGFFDLALAHDVRDREKVDWSTLLGELEAVIAAFERRTLSATVPRPRDLVATVQAYVQTTDVVDRQTGSDQLSRAWNWLNTDLIPGLTDALRTGQEAMQQLQATSRNEFQFSMVDWRPYYELSMFCPRLNGEASLPRIAYCWRGHRLMAHSRSGNAELHIPVWAYITSREVWLIGLPMIGRGGQPRAPWDSSGDRPLAVLHEYGRAVGPLPPMLEKSVTEAAVFGAETAQLFVELATRYVEKVIASEKLPSWGDGWVVRARRWRARRSIKQVEAKH